MYYRLFASAIICILIDTCISLVVSKNVSEGDGIIQFACSGNSSIYIENVTKRYTHCTNEQDEKKCISRLKMKLGNKCNGNISCTFDADSLFDTSCERTSRFLDIEYWCYCDWWLYWNKRQTVCSNFLNKIHCGKRRCGWWRWYTIQIEEVTHADNIKYSSCSDIQIKDNVVKLCENQLECKNPDSNDTFLFHKHQAVIFFQCLDKESTKSTDISLKTTKAFGLTTTDAFAETSEDIELTTSTDSPVETSEEVTLSLDREGRILISRTTDGTKETRTLCSVKWDDVDARVLCKFLNSFWTGVSKNVSSTSYEKFPFAIHCLGNETSPFLCPYSVERDLCQSDVVAGAECFTASSGSSSEIKGHNNTIGIVVGVVISCIGIFAIIAVFICIQKRKKNNGKRSIKEENNYGMTDYTGNQNIALPISNNVTSKVPSKHSGPSVYLSAEKIEYDCPNLNESNLCNNDSKTNPDRFQKRTLNNNTYADIDSSTEQNCKKDDSYVILDPTDTGFIRGQQQVDTLQSYELAKPFEFQQEDGTHVSYELKEEGAYDTSMNILHKLASDDVYSHAVDTVYDTAGHGRKMEDDDGNAYDHFLGQKNDDDYNISNRN